MGFVCCFFFKYIHHVLEIHKIVNIFIEKNNQNLKWIILKVMEMLESNLFQILNIEGYVVWNSPFTTIAFTKNYEINIHEDKDDDLFFHFVLAKRYF